MLGRLLQKIFSRDNNKISNKFFVCYCNCLLVKVKKMFRLVNIHTFLQFFNRKSTVILINYGGYMLHILANIANIHLRKLLMKNVLFIGRLSIRINVCSEKCIFGKCVFFPKMSIRLGKYSKYFFERKFLTLCSWSFCLPQAKSIC